MRDRGEMERNQTHDNIFELLGSSQHLGQLYEVIFIVLANVSCIFCYLCLEGKKTKNKKTQTQNVE